MNRCIWPLLACAVLVCGCGKSWQDYTSEEGKFSCRMPGKVTTQTKSMPTAAGNLTLHVHLVDSRDDAFMVGYADYAPGTPWDLEAAANGMAMMGGGTIVSKNRIKVEGYEAIEIEFKISSPREGHAAARVFVTGNRVYEILAIGSKTRLDSKDTQEFFNSFKLLK